MFYNQSDLKKNFLQMDQKQQQFQSQIQHFDQKTRITQGHSYINSYQKICQNCHRLRDQLQSQIFLLKDKSHQSFMQVIQVQQLHEQQLQMIKIEHQQELILYKQDAINLKQEVAVLRQEVTTLRQEAIDFSKQITTLKDEVATLRGEAVNLKEKAMTFKEEAINSKQQAINLKEETIILREELERLSKELNRNMRELVQMEKNAKHHNVNLDLPSFLIQNIQIIKCDDSNFQESRLDESALCQFHQFIDSKRDLPFQDKNNCINQLKNNKNQHISPCDSQIPQTKSNLNSYLQLKASNNNLHGQTDNQKKKIQQDFPTNKQREQVQQKIQKLNLRVVELQSEVQSLWQTNQQLKKDCARFQSSQKATKNNYQSLYKESKFMADHIRTLANDKFKLERKLKESEKEIRQLRAKNKGQSSLVFLNQDKNLNKSIKSILEQPQQLENSGNFLQKSTNERNESNLLLQRISSIQEIQPPRLPQHIQRSELLEKESKIQIRKSMPNYNKITNISPLFKRPNIEKELLTMSTHNKDKSNGKSTLMEDIRNALDMKSSMKRSVMLKGNETSRTQKLLHQLSRKKDGHQLAM